jgi:uncharacterized damage-inducible protein DinB
VVPLTADADPKAVLQHYLRVVRDALLWKLDGLSEYDVRRPMTPTGTNLLGVVKHVASVAAGYGSVFDRPFAEPLPWFEPGAEPNADMWAAADESRAQILDLWHKGWAHLDATIEALSLDAVGQVPWWPPETRAVTLQRIIVHMIAETNRHAGHADIVREQIDGATGMRVDNSNMPPDVDDTWWAAYRQRLEDTARAAYDA